MPSSPRPATGLRLYPSKPPETAVISAAAIAASAARIPPVSHLCSRPHSRLHSRPYSCRGGRTGRSNRVDHCSNHPSIFRRNHLRTRMSRIRSRASSRRRRNSAVHDARLGRSSRCRRGRHRDRRTGCSIGHSLHGKPDRTHRRSLCRNRHNREHNEADSPNESPVRILARSPRRNNRPTASHAITAATTGMTAEDRLQQTASGIGCQQSPQQTQEYEPFHVISPRD